MFPYVSLIVLMFGLAASAQSQEANPPQPDPFGDVAAAEQPLPAPEARSWPRRFFTENFGFRKEIMSQVDSNEQGQAASRQSIGFEVLKKFSSETATIASFDFQGRLVRRDGYNPVINDMEGQARPGWAFEYHNLYLDFYNVLNPGMSEEQRRKNIGRFNFRIGRFYVPFGLNLQTDTHGTVLQLSNGRDFGFERDWYAGFWGSFNRHLNYDVYYLAGSGYDLKFKGQGGLGAARLSLSNQSSSEHGLEGGLSIVGGKRLSSETTTTHRIETERIGLDARYRKAVPTGLVTFTSEISGGRDGPYPVFMQLEQAEYLHSSRRWGLAMQYRRFQQYGLGVDSSLIGEISWYFRNDVANSNAHWIKLNIERQIEQIQGPPRVIFTLEYYFYR
jgi:hypothetical protein